MIKRTLLRRRADILMEDLYDLWEQRGVVVEIIYILKELDKEQGQKRKAVPWDRRTYKGRRLSIREVL